MTPPSGFAAHLPFQGRLIFFIFLLLHNAFSIISRRDRLCRVRSVSSKGKSRWKRSTGTFPKSHNSKRQTGRSGLVRSALEKLSLFSPTFPVRQKHGAGSFAVCGQRLRGHVPSKNTSPAALSWSSLFGATVLKSFCSCTMVFVFVLAVLQHIL